MSDTIKISPRQKKVDRYLRAAMIGTIAILALLPLNGMLEFFPDDFSEGDEITKAQLAIAVVFLIGAIAVLISLIYSFIYMVWRRRTDEFTLAMWHSGTTVAFFIGIAWLLLGGIVEDVFDAYAVAVDPTSEALEVSMIDQWAVYVILAAFFIGFHFKRLRGDI